MLDQKVTVEYEVSNKQLLKIHFTSANMMHNVK